MTAATLSSHRCHLGEGAAYDPIRDRACWVDILERHLFEADLATGAVTRHALPFMASAVAWIDDDHQLLVAENGLHARDVRSGALDLLLPLEADQHRTRSNDARVHPSGSLWVGTMGREAQPGAGAIYHVFQGQISRLFASITIPNAICFAPDGATAYFTDTVIGLLNRVPVDPADGRPTGPPAPLYDHRGGAGGLDGAVTDAEGLIWNARWGAGCVDAYTPAGQRVHTIQVPATRPSCPAFIGPRLDRLLVTTAYEGMTDGERRLDPGHGHTFVVTPPATGRPEPRVKLSAR